MKTKSFFVPGFFAALFCLSNCQQPSKENLTTVEANLSNEARVKRGEYIVSFAGCDNCHTPKMMTPNGPRSDKSLRLSGHPAAEPFTAGNKKELISKELVAVFSPSLTAAAGPWGVSYASNLTPDDTGIGNWTEAQFMKAIREGKSKGLDGTRPLLPPMPWKAISNMTDEDLKAVFAYLKTVKPVRNVVPNPKPL